MAKVIDALWFSGRDVIGIVLVDTGYGHKCYIGAVEGQDESEDQEDIAAHGSPFVLGASIWPHIKDWAQ